jgi:hypothetical protein
MSEYFDLVTAYHESGHVITAAYFRDPIHSVELFDDRGDGIRGCFHPVAPDKQFTDDGFADLRDMLRSRTSSYKNL